MLIQYFFAKGSISDFNLLAKEDKRHLYLLCAGLVLLLRKKKISKAQKMLSAVPLNDLDSKCFFGVTYVKGIIERRKKNRCYWHKSRHIYFEG